MSRQGHKRPRLSRKALALVATLTLGAGGVAVVANQASAGSAQRGGRTAVVTATIDCPDVGDRLRDVPDQARAQVDENLARLDGQVADAYGKLASGAAAAPRQQKGLLDDLGRQRGETIEQLADAIGRVTRRPDGLQGLSTCRMKQTPPEELAVADGTDGAAAPGDGQAQNLAARSGGAPARSGGPARSDFVAITTVKPDARRPAPGRNASTGSFSVSCGRNENGHFNPDNVIVAPGVGNGAHHMHDYVGNVSTDAFSSNNSLAAAGTTCTNGDQSTYYWPVLRLRDGRQERDAGAPGGGKDGNIGTILRPKQVTIDFKGSPAGPVTAMPRFLRIITGDAKAFTNGTANANASWSCTGFEDRQLKDKYPICPKGSDVVRTFTFQSCWDGRNTDSANHRTHVAFADKDGRCKNGFKALPQLVQRIVYGIPQGARFAVDSFPEQLHKPVTDHGDFINVMNDRLMAEAVRCINSGRNCR
ncbi:DUF1996 domain-containing protein [Streptomyces sp. WAC06614]|uniref:DUF1996 domain-containing protein n=1 Tax=Streptomyces sp. WAC06614 TaxID=2487416 RepID=UPI000F78CC63|nr:DUF1996 domain-containing protein [Streptomyces sp. WAC06614]RSS74772.1 DUF1996 domain-containing protein [Streptomyces sp. WAC06614]